MHLCDSLRSHAASTPHKAAVLCGERSLSYQALDDASTLLAHWLLAQGLHPGDRVALHWPNSIEVVELFFGLFKAGLIAVTINTRLKPPEIAYIFRHSEARLCFSEQGLAPQAEQAGVGCPVLSQLPRLEPADCFPSLPPINPDLPAVVLYTSGTTARPKGVVHSHRSLFHGGRITFADLIDSSDILLPFTPLMHVSGLACCLASSVSVGASLVLVPGFDPAAILEAIESFGVTLIGGLPTQVHLVVEEQARRPRHVSSLRSVFSGGDSVSIALQNRFAELFGTPIVEIYGMTESVPITLNPKGAIRQGSLGILRPDLEVRLLDLSGRDVLENETGEIAVRSPANFLGYWNDSDATQTAMVDGWLRTGDLASRDSDGYYWFKGRQKEIIIRGGSNISPQEVEEALYRHPAVCEAGVVGAPDPVLGEIPVAFVVLREAGQADPQELLRFAGQYLADYKLPEKILFLDALPKSPTGKVQRRALKEMLLADPAFLARSASA